MYHTIDNKTLQQNIPEIQIQFRESIRPQNKLINKDDFAFNKKINVWPQPASNKLFFNSNDLKAFEILSSNGTFIFAGISNGEIDISSLKSGIYLLSLNDSIKATKFVVLR